MKKLLFLVAATLCFSFSAQAQLGNLAAKAAKAAAKAMEKKLDKAVDSAINNAADKAVNKATADINTAATSTNAKGDVLTPREALGKFPTLPSQQNVIDFASENLKPNPSMLKLAANPVSRYAAKLNISIASLTTAWSDNEVVNAKREKQLDEYLMAEYGVTMAQLEAMSDEEREALVMKKSNERLGTIGLTADDVKAAENMSEEEAQAYLSSKVYAKMMQDAATGQVFGQDTKELAKKASYKPALELLEQYNACAQQIDEVYGKSYQAAKAIWEQNYASKVGSMSNDRLMAQYLKEILPAHFESIMQAQKIRKDQQMAIAEKLDAAIAEHPAETEALTILGLTYAQQCAIAYLNEGNNLTGYYTPAL